MRIYFVGFKKPLHLAGIVFFFLFMLINIDSARSATNQTNSSNIRKSESGVTMQRSKSKTTHHNKQSTEAKIFPEARVAIVDVQSILEQSLAIASIRKIIDEISKDIQQDVSKKEADLKEIEKELLNKRNAMSQEEFEKEVGEFNKNVNQAQKLMQERKTRLEQAHSEAVGKVHKATISIISELSKEHKFNIVIPSSQVLFAKADLNITQEVLDLLNQRLQSVKVNYK